MGSTRAVCGGERLRAGTRQRSHQCLCGHAVGSAGSAHSLRLVEACRGMEHGVGHPQLPAGLPGLQPRGCIQAFCPLHFGMRQAQVVVVLGVFPCRVWCGIPSWLVSTAVAAACSARKIRGLAILAEHLMRDACTKVGSGAKPWQHKMGPHIRLGWSSSQGTWR